MRFRRSTLALVTLPFALAAAPWMADLGFSPAEGSKVERTYGIELDFELGDLTVIADGQDMSEMIPADFEGKAELAMEVQDHFVRSAGGRALELVRTFTSIEASVEAAGDSKDMDGADELEGKSVRFVWNEDEGVYDKSYHESEGEESALESIGADMDLSALLPPRSVEVGDVWSIDAKELGSVLLFGTEMKSDSDDEMGAIFGQTLLPQLEAMLQGFKISCEYKGEREEAGAKVGVVGLDLVGEGEVDLESVILAAMEVQELPVEISLDFDTATLSVSFNGKGELLWNVERGLLHAFDLGADMEVAVDIDVAMEAEGQSHEMQAEVELLGRGTWKVRTPTGE